MANPVYTVSGTLNPDATGNYYYSGIDPSGYSYYTLKDSDFEIRVSSLSPITWQISSSSYPDGVWYRIDPNILGAYTIAGTYTGIPTVAEYVSSVDDTDVVLYRAKTRGEIKELVHMHTGRTKDTLENYAANAAIKLALMVHPFKDSLSIPAGFAITEGSTAVDISSLSDLLHVVTARIVDLTQDRSAPLIMKQRQWWDRNVTEPDDNQKGWPVYGLRWGTSIILDRPADSGLHLKLRVSTVPTFASDDTVCPVGLLDLFVEKYVTAQVFQSIQDFESFAFWKLQALGPKWDIDGTPGGDLLIAILSDYDTSIELKVEPPAAQAANAGGVSVKNLITGDANYGNTEWWR